jgi:UDP-N-acetylglucosamine--N-acetylmuramyl-(pentapeptide) pyrophosphoryl-undecaprenol N-acetylglucosamine transferase
MADAYLASDLIIARSGAVSCAEISSVGRFALLVPLPIGNGEQEANARELTENGAAEICRNRDFTAEWLDINLQRLVAQAQLFRGSAQSSRHSHAAAAVGELGMQILRGGAQ